MSNKRLLILLFTCICIKIMMAQPPSWAISQLKVVPGDVAQLEIGLENANTNYTAFQFDLTLPEGISIKKDGEGLLMVKLNNERISDHQVLVSEILQNTYRIFGYSMNNAIIKGSSGTLLTITLNAENDIGLGSIEGHTDTGLMVADKNEITELGTCKIVFQILEKEYTLTYEVDGKVFKSYKMKYGTKITPETTPTKDGYTFSGWSEIPETMPANDVTITGTFSINKYKLIYQVDGEEYKNYEVEYNASITLEEAPTKEGYAFSGWSNNIPETMPAENVIITGTFSINKYKLLYKVDGTEYKSYDVKYGATITPEVAPTKEGYSFSGWSEIPETMPAKDVTITGSFTQVDYEVEGTKYEISGDEVSIIEIDDTSGDVEIPSTVVINDKTYTVTSIADGAFMNDTKMTSVSIPNSVTSIGVNAFNGCTRLSEIAIGSAVTAIGSKAFANIKPGATTRGDNGIKISCYATSVPTTAVDAFDNTPIGDATLLVDDNLVSSYKSTAPWSSFGTIIGFNETTGINGISFENNSKAKIFSIDGKPLNNPQKGIIIIRMNDGKIKKVVVK